MSSPGDMSVRPIPPAELPAVARVADRGDRRRQEPRPESEQRKHPTQDETPDASDGESPPKAQDGAGGTIDLMA